MDEFFNQILTPLSRKIEVNNHSYLYFGGTAYLAIPQHKEFQKHYIEGINRFGLNNGTSRNNNIQLGIYDAAEEFAALKFGSEAALITSSGYLAAQLTIKTLSTYGIVRYAPGTHPALWASEVPLTQGSFKQWAQNIVTEINQSKERDWVIITNSLNNLYPEIYDFSFISEIDAGKKILLIVDDSHGIGIVNNGKGAFCGIPKRKNIETIVVASMAKALGVDAGLILASKDIISLLKQSNEFMGASPPSAAGLFAFMNASTIYEEEYKKLMHLTAHLGKTLKANTNWSFIPGFPVFLTSTAAVEKVLLNHGILISSFAYPDKNGNLINRIVLSSWHTLMDIEELILALQNINEYK